jgi:hypothetical protein
MERSFSVKPVKVDAKKLMRDIKVILKVTHMREIKIRTFFASKLIKLAALIMNCEIVIEHKKG